MQSTSRDTALVVERVIRAPRERVFRAFTDPALLTRWWVPAGAVLTHCTVDLRVGGMFLTCMRFPDGKVFWGRGVYREIAPPERLAFVDSFSNERGEVVSPTEYGMSPEHPAESLVEVRLEPVAEGTRVTLRHELPLVLKEREGTSEGWTAMLAQLAATVEA